MFVDFNTVTTTAKYQKLSSDRIRLRALIKDTTKPVRLRYGYFSDYCAVVNEMTKILSEVKMV